MGYDLYNTNDDTLYYRFNIGSWGPVLQLAQEGGWQPHGTTHNNPFWGGGYHSNDGQIVTEADALALADGLEKVLVTIPDRNLMPGSIIHTKQPITPEFKQQVIDSENRFSKDLGTPPLPENPLALTLAEWKVAPEPVPDVLIVTFEDTFWRPEPRVQWSGDGKKYLQGFIEFCRKGAFEIH